MFCLVGKNKSYCLVVFWSLHIVRCRLSWNGILIEYMVEHASNFENMLFL